MPVLIVVAAPAGGWIARLVLADSWRNAERGPFGSLTRAGWLRLAVIGLLALALVGGAPLTFLATAGW